jgi:dihydroorotate dehydrogenase/NAD-dependent dihydropyrimidine dehydrogenase PreA subunit
MADLAVDLLGLHFPTPILCGAGPQSDGAIPLMAALDGGAGGLVARTVLTAPLPVHEPSLVPYGKDGLLTCQRGSARSVADWLADELPPVAAAAGAHGVPLIASLAGTADEVAALGPRLVGAGARALEYATAFRTWEEAAAAVKALRGAVSVPVIAKLSLSHGEEIAERAAALAPYVDAFTCIAGFGPVLDLDVGEGGAPRLGGPTGYGLLSGTPMHPIAVRTVFEVARRVTKPVIAAGGALTVRDVLEFLAVGASLVQVTTGALLHGPAVFGRLAGELNGWLDAHGHSAVGAVQGRYLHRFGGGQRVVTAAEESPVLDDGLCLRCGICADVCYYGAVTAPLKALPVFATERCFQCGFCVSACPTGSLRFRPREAVTL